MRFFDLFINIYVIIYLTVSLRFTNKKILILDNYFSDNGKIDAKWIKQVIIGSILAFSLDIALIASKVFTDYFTNLSNYVMFCFIAMIVVILGYRGIRQTTLIVPKDFLIYDKLKNPALDNQEVFVPELSKATSLKDRLLEIIDLERPYLDDELTLHKLAEITRISEKKLSILLNHYMDTNFYDFVNKYRLKAVKEEFSNPNSQKYTIMAIANDCGFKSKSTFNRIFKKDTGLSPTEYRRRIATETNQGKTT